MLIKTIISYIRGLKKFKHDKKEYIRQKGNDTFFEYDLSKEYKILQDYNESAGNIDSHYFFQDIFVAKYVLENGFTHVYDIGSRIDGYISHLLAGGIRVTMIDIRPLQVDIENLEFIQSNATNLTEIQDNSLPIITCLHAIEHFGLGRYGDPIDYNGWKKALHAFARKIVFSGILILSVPCSNADVLCFNAHRIFNPVTIFNEVSDLMKLELFTVIRNHRAESFSFADYEEAHTELVKIAKTLGKYDCGIFIFRKIFEL